MDTVKSVPSGVVTRTRFFPSSAAIASFARCVALWMSSTVRSPGPMPSPLEVGDDDPLVRADHGLVQVARWRHREPDVGAPPAHLRLVVHHYGPRATVDDDPCDRGGLGCVGVVADDRHEHAPL